MGTNEVTQEVKKRAGWSVFMGVLTTVIGAVLAVYPMATGTLTTVFLGSALLLVGIAQFIFALNSTTAGSFFLKVALSVLYGMAGFGLVMFPTDGLAALTGVLGGLLLIQAGVQTAAAFQLRPVTGWGWILFDALMSLVLGILILAGWPNSSVWAIGTLVGVSVFIGGVARTVVASRIRSGATSVEQVIRGTA